MWKSAVVNGIELLLRQMLLLLSAFAFNLFLKPLEYPIYRLRLRELIFVILPLKKVSTFFLEGRTECVHNVASREKNYLCLFQYSRATMHLRK